jgi:N-acetylglucosaminyl-diphospho-decaprenol L-rhamnosyltransferase
MNEIEAVIVDYKSPDLPRSIESLLNSNSVTLVHVVDNHGSLDWVQLEERFGSRIGKHGFTRNAGFGGGVNRALNQVSSEFVLLLNPDARLVSWDLPYTVGLMRSSGLWICGPNICDSQGVAERSGGSFQSVSDLLRRVRRLPSQVKVPMQLQPDEVKVVDWVSGACMLVDVVAVRPLGGFDERYFLYYEDMDLCARVKSAGGRVARIGAGEVEHVGGGTMRNATARRRMHICQSMIRFLWQKHWL